ncbi:MAG: hypothetical protein ACRDJ4_15365, partial [Actinomycetota bacterium]
MTEPRRRRLAWPLFATWAVVLGASWVIEHTLFPPGEETLLDIVPPVAAFAGLAAVGALVMSHQPRNPIGALLLGMALVVAVGNLLGVLGRVMQEIWHSPAVLSATFQITGDLLWIAGVSLAVPVFILFPEGRATSAPRRFALWAVGIGVGAYSVGTLLRPGPLGDLRNGPPNPLGVPALAGALEVLEGAQLLVAVALGIAIVSLIARFIRSRGEERQQHKWVAYSAAMVAVVLGSQGVFSPVLPNWAENLLFSLAVMAVPAGIGIAILKYRLYDIDVVINKTLVYGTLAGFITAVYVALVVGVGRVVGAGDRPNLALSIAATAVVAVAFQPVRSRVQLLANRLVYGKRATPYEVLSEFSSRVAGVYAIEELLGRMARLLAEGTGAKSATVWLRMGPEMRPAATWPEGTSPEQADRRVEVSHRGEVLGALSLAKRPGESLSSVESKLIADLAAQAGVVLRNVRLTEELLARLDELAASRKRLVAAQ